MKVALGACIASCLISGTGVAQTTAGGPVSASQPKPADSGPLPDIIVTATRRSENLQSVPVAVTALTGSQLAAAGIASSKGLEQVTPSLVFGQTANSLQPTIRGVGTRGAPPGDESNVAMYLDGVYQPSMVNTNFDLLNIDRIEVLKGPQGTLFGRNATGGAISIITRKPSQNFSGAAEAGYGRFNGLTGSLYLTGPVASTLSADVAIKYMRDDGYVDDLIRGGKANPSNSISVRTRLRWKPSGNADFILAGSYARSNDPSAFEFQPLNRNTRARALTPAILIPTKPGQIASNLFPIGRSRQYDVNLTGSIDFGGVSLETSTDYQDNLASFLTDSDGTTANLGSQDGRVQFTKAWSQELRLVSQGRGKFRWVLGAMAFGSKAGFDPFFANITTVIRGVQWSRAYSAFGEATWEAVDHLFLTGGLRYSSEKRTFDPFVNTPRPRQEKTFRRWTPRAAIRYELAPNTSVYASYSRGFKSGLFNFTSTQLTPVGEETITAYEIGLKSKPARWLRANFSAFSYRYDGLQIQARDTTTASITLQNAGKTSNKGAEADIEIAPGGGFNLRLGAAWQHAKFTSFPNAQITVPVLVGGVAVGGNSQIISDITGNELIRAPHLTLTAGPTYRFPVGSGEIRLAGNVNYNSGYYLEISNRLRQPAYVLANARLSYSMPGERFRISAWADNIFDKHIVMFLTTSANGDLVSYRKPLTYGLTLATKF